MHAHAHPISLAPTDDGRYHHQSILGHKVPYASLVPSVVCLGGGVEIELEGLGAGDEEGDAANVLQQ